MNLCMNLRTHARVTRRAALTGLAASLAMPSIATTQSWPSRPVLMIVPFPAGGPTDTLARTLANEFSNRLGQQFIVENHGGAGGNIGAAMVARATPDGYTILFGTPGPVATNKLMYKDLSFDPEKDFAPIALIAKSPLIIVAHPSVPAKDIGELAAYAKAHPGKLNVGYPGNGTLGHVTAVLLQSNLGISMTGVPYRGTAPLTTDLLGGQVDLGMDFMSTYVPLVKDGKLRAIAVTSVRRVADLPEVMTVREAGIKNFEATAWYALVAPTGVPAEVVQKINGATNDFLGSDKGKQTLATFDMLPAGGTPADLRAYIGGELTKWGPVVKGANITL